MTRPLGKIPAWPIGTQVDYFTPDTFDPYAANYPFGEIVRWFGVHDGIEVANYSPSVVLDSGSNPVGGTSLWGTPGDAWRRNHLAFDPRGVFYAGVRNAGGNGIAGILWSRDGKRWTYDTDSSVLQIAGVTDTWYQIALTDVGDVFAWATGRTGSVYEKSRALQRIGTPYPFPIGGYTEYDYPQDADVLVIENAQFDLESRRMFVVGWNYDTGDGFVFFVDPVGDPGDPWYTPAWLNDFPPAGIQIRFVAVAPGYKLIASPTHLWWGQGILSTFRHIAVADAMPGETLIKGLVYSETDKVFIAIGVNRIWTSANGVQWFRTNAPAGGRVYTGAVACLGGAVVAVDTQPALVIGLNALRDWYIVPCPSTNTGSSPIQNIYTIGNRLTILNSRNAASIRHSLGTP